MIKLSVMEKIPNERKGNQAAVQAMVILLAAVVMAVTVNHFRADPLPLMGDWSADARMTLPSGRKLAISLEEARSLHLSGNVVFLDARPEEEFRKGHIAGARSLPWAEVEQRAMDVVGDVADEVPLITYCDGDTCHLSKDLALFLDGLGYTRVYVLVNGWSVWQENGLPVESGN